MKFRNSLAILAFSAAFLLAGCGEEAASSAASSSKAGSSIPADSIVVTFDTQGGSAIASQTIAKGSKATRPATDPTKEGFTFDDWYADAVCATPFNFDQALNANTTVYAGWEEAEVSTEEEVDDMLYFKDTGWWNNAAAYTVAKFDTGEPEKMTWISFTKTGERETGGDDGFNYWSIMIPEGASTVTFYRSWDNPPDVIMDLNGPKTAELSLADRTGNMYDISGVATYDWATLPEVEGVWGTYTPAGPAESTEAGPIEGEYTYTCTGLPDWITNDGCVVFAWVWSPNDAGSWKSLTYGAGEKPTEASFGVSEELTGFLLARCAAGTTSPDWNIHGDEAGRVYNQTENIDCVSGTYSYECASWKEYK